MAYGMQTMTNDKTKEIMFHNPGRNELSIVGNDNSIMEYAYALVYMAGIGGSVGVGVAVVVMAICYRYLITWALLLVGFVTFLLVTAVSTAVMLWGIVYLIRANTQQPRDDNGRFMRPVPVYHNGRHSFDLFTAVKRKIGKA